MAKQKRTAIEPTREANFPEWYQQVIKSADMAENSSTRGCMVIKPWGYAIWEKAQRMLDDRIKDHGAENIYGPLLIPLSFFNKEAEHVKGFATECAVVTHHRLVEEDGQLVPDGKLAEPLVVRPTSETVFGELFSRWIQSYRDLPCKLNQWANVMRWEMRPRMFLRTAEFLWQEGHTAHETKEEASSMAKDMAFAYEQFFHDVLAIPVVLGEKSAIETFAGAQVTYSLEALMQDGKALQACTSHFLGQNFSRGFSVTYQTQHGGIEHVWNTSWGVSTRMIGGLIMVHSDDDGLRLPPRIAPQQIVILPIKHKSEHHAAVDGYVAQLQQALHADVFGERCRVRVDDRPIAGGEKKWDWIKKGVPILLEVGLREAESGTVSCVLRHDLGKRIQLGLKGIAATCFDYLHVIQNHYLQQALAYRHDMTEVVTDQHRWDRIKKKKSRGFFLVPWAGDDPDERALQVAQMSIRVILSPQDAFYQEYACYRAECIVTGKMTEKWALVAQAY